MAVSHYCCYISLTRWQYCCYIWLVISNYSCCYILLFISHYYVIFDCQDKNAAVIFDWQDKNRAVIFNWKDQTIAVLSKWQWALFHAHIKKSINCAYNLLVEIVLIISYHVLVSKWQPSIIFKAFWGIYGCWVVNTVHKSSISLWSWIQFAAWKSLKEDVTWWSFLTTMCMTALTEVRCVGLKNADIDYCKHNTLHSILWTASCWWLEFQNKTIIKRDCWCANIHFYEILRNNYVGLLTCQTFTFIKFLGTNMVVH